MFGRQGFDSGESGVGVRSDCTKGFTSMRALFARTGWLRPTVALPLALATVAGAPAAGQVELTPMLLSGAPAPVGEPDVVFGGFIGAPALAAGTGELFVRAELAGPEVDSTNDVGLFLVDPAGQVTLLAREGDPAPGLRNVAFANLNTLFLPSFNADGVAVFPAQLASACFSDLDADGTVNGADLGLLLGMWGDCADGCNADLNGDGVVDGADVGLLLGDWGGCTTSVFTFNDTALFTGRPGDVSMVIREGDQPPGVSPPGTVITGFAQGIINNNGVIGIRTVLQFPTPPAGSGRIGFASHIFEDGAPTLIAATEHDAPGFPPSLPFATVGGLSLNSSNEHAFTGAVFDPNTGFLVAAGVWSGSFTSYDLIAATDDPAPGTEQGTLFDIPQGTPAKGSSGDVIFKSLLKGPEIVFGNDIGLWRDRDGVLSLVVRLGDPAPEISPTAIYAGIGETPVGDSSRTAVFRGEFVGEGINTANDMAIIAVMSDNSRRVVARTAQQAPGVPDGQFFTNFPIPPTINANGRAAFLGQLIGQDVDATNREGIWVVEEDGSAELVARQGDAVEVAPGDVRTIFELSALLSQSVDTGEPRGIDDADELVLTILFTDLSSAIVRAKLPSALPGDLDSDGLVDGSDLGLLLGQWGACGSGCTADLNADGVVDGADLGALLGAWTV